MGCYGIGISRLMGLLAEHFADDKGLVWPAAVAPARVYLVRLGDNTEVVKQADELYEHLMKQPGGVLYDDRDVRAGAGIEPSVLAMVRDGQSRRGDRDRGGSSR